MQISPKQASYMRLGSISNKHQFPSRNDLSLSERLG